MLTMLYEAQGWPAKNQHVQKIRVMEVKMLNNIRDKVKSDFYDGQDEKNETEIVRES